MIDKEELEAQLEQDYKELLEDVEYHIEGLKAEFAEEVSKYLEEEGITRAELARRMGTSPAWITKMLRTNWNMTMETMAKLAFALGMKVEPKFVPIRGIVSRLEYHEEHCWAEIPHEYIIEKPEKAPKEQPIEKVDFQPLREGIDFESIPTYEEAKVA